MFGAEKSIENLQQLFAESKKYLELQTEYAKLELTEKLTILLSTLILVLVLIILGMVALFYFSFTIAYVLAPHIGGLMSSFALITLFLLVIMGVVYYYRQKLIVAPMVKFLANLFLRDNMNQQPKEEVSDEQPAE
ncbi:MAG: phage holin family protein [Bacteroidaceae bacterium]|nr:phage holin family protein [Bacteroidaceae bacterium]